MLSISYSKKYLSLIVLMFFLFNIVGYYLWFGLLKNSIQKEITEEIRSGLADKDLTLIILPSGDDPGICWLKARKEFTYHGEMYDVVKITTENGRKCIYCINDKKEKKLLADFSRQHEPDSKTKKLLSNFQYTCINQPGYYSFILETSDNDYCIKSFKISLMTKDVTIPPPKAFSIA